MKTGEKERGDEDGNGQYTCMTNKALDIKTIKRGKKKLQRYKSCKQKNKDFTDLTREADAFPLNHYLKKIHSPSCRRNAVANCQIWKDLICAKRQKLPRFSIESSSCNTPPDEESHRGYSRWKRVTGGKTFEFIIQFVIGNIFGGYL